MKRLFAWLRREGAVKGRAVDEAPLAAEPQLEWMRREIEVLRHRVARLEEMRASELHTDEAVVRSLEVRLQLALGQQDITKAAAIAAEAKVDAIASCLGIDVSMFEGEARVALFKNEEFISGLRDFIGATRGIEELLDAQTRAARGYDKILRGMLKRGMP